MKTRIALIILIGLMASGLALAGTPPIELVNFDHYSEAGETHLVLGANNPFFYTLYRPDSTTLTVDIPGMDVSRFLDIVVQSDEVRALAFEVIDPGTENVKTSLVIQLRPGVTHTHWMQGTNLYLDFVASSSRVVPEAEVTEAPVFLQGSDLVEENAVNEIIAPMPSVEEDTPVSVQQPEAVTEVAEAAPVLSVPAISTQPAEFLLDVGVVGNTVRIEADGSLEYQTFTLPNPDRIVVDLMGVSNRIRSSTLPAEESPFVERLRVSQFKQNPKVSRVVMDMSSAVEYSVRREANVLVVYLGTETPPAVTALPEPETVTAAVETESDLADVAVVEWAEAASSEEDGFEFMDSEVAVNDAQASVIRTEFTPVEITEEDLAAFGDEEDITLYETADTSFDVTKTAVLSSEGFERRTIGGRVGYKGLPVTLDLKDADIKDIFRLFADISGYNFVLDSSVSGTITIVLREVPWDQALEIVLKNQGLGQQFQGNVVFIAPLGKLAQEEAAKRKLREAQEEAAERITIMRTLSYAKAGEIQGVIKSGKMLSKRGEAFTDKRTNALFITDIPERVEMIENLIKALDRPTRQVEIEARIVETTKEFAKGFGINWLANGFMDQAHGTTTDYQFPHRVQGSYAIFLPVGGANNFLSLSMGNVLDTFTLDVSLEAMERDSKGRVLSQPRVLALDNETAMIESGIQIPVTTTTDLQLNVTFKSATLKLEVTPHITHQDTIILDIKLKKDEPDFSRSIGSQGIPPIITRKVQTQTLLQDGETAVIGGVFKLSDSVGVNRVPGLSRIPIIGWFFKSKTVNKANDELLVFITPRIQK